LHLASGAVVPPRGTQVIPTGERLVVEMPGGGGLGDPLKRDPESVRRDVSMGYVSIESARNLYKVVFDSKGAVDAAATRTARGA
jgi:N-methylhydantoinase B